jgi:hypothetical protein
LLCSLLGAEVTLLVNEKSIAVDNNITIHQEKIVD